jgi:hypothetical protein
MVFGERLHACLRRQAFPEEQGLPVQPHSVGRGLAASDIIRTSIIPASGVTVPGALETCATETRRASTGFLRIPIS